MKLKKLYDRVTEFYNNGFYTTSSITSLYGCYYKELITTGNSFKEALDKMFKLIIN